MIENKNILFIANGGKEWIGGLYYIKNIIYTLIKNEKVDNSTKMYILAKEENLDIFKSFLSYENIDVIVYEDNRISKFLNRLTNKILHKSLDLVLLKNIKKFNIDYIYPVNTYPYLFLKWKCVYWIPDFQHIHLPEMFSEDEVRWRNKLYRYIAVNHKNLILSSEDAYKDYKSLYQNYMEGVHVLSFESYIDDDLKDIDCNFIKNTLEKYNITNEFVFLPNQFWKHKNHITAFKAINYVVNEKGKQICLVCTGNTNDYRNKDHFNNLLNFIKENKLEDNIKILGFISRKEQLVLMNIANAIVQPSLFEGWGTVVEDAKALDKKIIMSDIDVHFEQKNEKCILFRRDNYTELGDVICNLL